MSQQSATFYAYLNGGIGALTQSKSSTTQSYLNAGIEALIPTQSSTTGAYLNAGIAAAQETIVIRQPRGWGVLPAGPQIVVLKTEQAKATFSAYENTTT